MTSLTMRRHRGGAGDLVRNLIQPTRFVILVALVGGILFSLIVPPLKGADERNHLARAVQLSLGQLSTARQGELYGARLPAGYQRYMDTLTREVYWNPDHTAYLNEIGSGSATGPKIFVGEGTTASYGAGAYLEYVPVVKLGLILGLPIGVLLYLARFAGVVAYALLVGLATHRLPAYKWALVAVALIPEMLNQAATVSADGLTNALTLLVIAWFFRLCVDQRLSRAQTIEVCAAIVVLSIAKPPYFLFVLPLLYLVARYWRERKLRLPGLVAVSCIPLFLFTVEYQRKNSTPLDLPGFLLDQTAPDNYAYRDTHPNAQLSGLVHHPMRLPDILLTTITHQGLLFPRQLFGLLANYQLPGWLVLMSAICVILGASIGWRSERLGRSPLDGIVMCVVTGVCAVAISASVYVLADALGAPRIDGLTPRYFLALIPGLVLGVAAIHSNWISSPRDPAMTVEAGGVVARRRPVTTIAALLMALLVTVLICTIVGMIHFYYTGSVVTI